MNQTHHLKLLDEYWYAVKSGHKNFETSARGSVRRRQYQALFPMKQEVREFIRE